MPPKTIPRCPYCSKGLPSQNAVRLHVSATSSCNQSWKREFSQKFPNNSKTIPLKRQREDSPQSLPNIPTSPINEEIEAIADNFTLPTSIMEENSPPAATNKRVHVEEIEDEDAHPHQLPTGLRFSEQYPRSIAHPIRLAKTCFEEQCDNDHKNNRQPWHPFASREEWELAMWLIDNVNQKATDEYLKLPLVN